MHTHTHIHTFSQVEKIVVFGLGKAFAWGFTEYYLGSTLVSPNCVQEEREIGVLRVWIGSVGCGKHQSVMNPVQLKWRPMDADATVVA